MVAQDQARNMPLLGFFRKTRRAAGWIASNPTLNFLLN
jgi:hypothetical protein